MGIGLKAIELEDTKEKVIPLYSEGGLVGEWF